MDLYAQPQFSGYLWDKLEAFPPKRSGFSRVLTKTFQFHVEPVQIWANYRPPTSQLIEYTLLLC